MKRPIAYLSIKLEGSENFDLFEMAKEQTRTSTQQARYLIMSGLAEWRRQQAIARGTTPTPAPRQAYDDDDEAKRVFDDPTTEDMELFTMGHPRGGKK